MKTNPYIGFGRIGESDNPFNLPSPLIQVLLKEHPPKLMLNWQTKIGVHPIFNEQYQAPKTAFECQVHLDELEAASPETIAIVNEKLNEL